MRVHGRTAVFRKFPKHPKPPRQGPNGPGRYTDAGVKLTDNAAKPKMRTKET
jgi:hypothetical protein